MRLTIDQVKALKDGVILKIFYSGSKWDNDFGKVFNAIKLNNKLYHIQDFNFIEEMNDSEGYEFEVAIQEG